MAYTSCSNCAIGRHFHWGANCASPSCYYVSCPECKAGTYQDQEKQLACKTDCKAGSYINSDQTACTACPIGFFQSKDGRSECETCSKGTYSQQEKQTSCKNCKAGKYNDQIASVSEFACEICRTGTYNTNSGSVSESACKNDCGAGSFIVEDKSRCDVCPFGSWQDQDDQSSCRKCIKGKVSRLTKQISDVCVECIIGSYNPYDGHTGECLPCLTANVKGSSECEGW